MSSYHDGYSESRDRRPAAVVPAGEADVIGIVPLGECDEVAVDTGEQCVGRGAEVEAAVIVEAGGNGFQDMVRRRAAAADENEFGLIPCVVEADGVGPGRLTVVFD